MAALRCYFKTILKTLTIFHVFLRQIKAKSVMVILKKLKL